MGPRVGLAISLGKGAIQIAADFAPVPALNPAVELFCGILQLCENVSTNRHAAFQLRDRCHLLLLTLRDAVVDMGSDKMNDALVDTINCLQDIKTKMNSWAYTNRLQSFTNQKQISKDIEQCHNEISDCLMKFQMISHIQIHDWQTDFQLNSRRDHAEIIEYMSEIQNSQDITRITVTENSKLVQGLMGMMQQLLTEQAQTADRTFNGLSSNLYQLSLQSGQLLPKLELNSGEVKRIGQHPMTGTASMDIYEGLYLGNEKVAIKVLRAVHSNRDSLRRFEREVKVWNKIWETDRGRHILPFYGFCQTDGPYPYMVSPWQNNGTVMEYVKNHSDSQVDYKHLIRGIASGIHVLHAVMNPPVVHGDIKGSNIVIDARGNPLIADFGLSQVIEDITGIPFTQSRGVSESFRWFAPEVCQGELSLAADIYAYAMTVLEILTHRQPYSDIKHMTTVVIQSARGDRPLRPTDPHVIARGLDDKLWNLMERCWSGQKLMRPDIQTVIAELP